MKRKIQSLILVLTIVISYSFKSSKSKAITEGQFTATLNDSINSNWNNSYYIITPNPNGNSITIYALKDNNVSLKLFVNATSVGTYEINGRTCSASYYVSENDIRNGLSGNISITSFSNNKVSGTFSFTDGIAENGINITNGIFTDVPVQ